MHSKHQRHRNLHIMYEFPFDFELLSLLQPFVDESNEIFEYSYICLFNFLCLTFCLVSLAKRSQLCEILLNIALNLLPEIQNPIKSFHFNKL